MSVNTRLFSDFPTNNHAKQSKEDARHGAAISDYAGMVGTNEEFYPIEDNMLVELYISICAPNKVNSRKASDMGVHDGSVKV